MSSIKKLEKKILLLFRS